MAALDGLLLQESRQKAVGFRNSTFASGTILIVMLSVMLMFISILSD